MTDFKFILGIIIGLVIGIAVESFLDKPCPEVKTANVKTVTTETTRTEGAPDTTITEKRETKKVKVRKTGTTEIKLKKNEPGVSKITIEQLNNNSNEAEVEFQYPEKTIVRVDTVYKETVIKDSTASIQTTEKQSFWQLAVGSRQDFENEVAANKYFEVSYQKKIWFFNLKGSAGVHNKLNDALSNLKMHTKIEINIPLN